MTNSQDVQNRIEGRIGIIELDRPQALNSLTLDMIRGIDEALTRFAEDDAVATVVILSSTPKAFCAGGDVRGVREDDLSGNYAIGDEFFSAEYALNYRLARYGKPIVALLEGVVMGGGFGISAHGSHRVITRRTLGAMPETAIGFTPDVGMSHRLTHLNVSAEVGIFLGLTGWRLNGADMMFTGLGTNVVEDPEALLETLRNNPLPDALDRHAAPVPEGSTLQPRVADIEAALSHDNILDVEKDLNKLAQGSDQFATTLRKQLDGANPTSLVATFELFRRSAQTDLATALRNEERVAAALRRQPNFAEGVRAVLVDKDHQAKFSPATTAEVDQDFWKSLLV